MSPRVQQRTSEAAGILLIRIAVLAFLLGELAKSWADPDLWGHVRFGGDILRTGLSAVDRLPLVKRVLAQPALR